MKHLLLSRVFPPHVGGSGRWFWELYRRLSREETIVAAGAHPDQTTFDRAHQLRVIRLPMEMSSWGVAHWRSAIQYRKIYLQLRALTRQYQIEQVHCGSILPEGLWAWMLNRRVGIPYLCYVHGEEINILHKSRELKWLMNRVLGSAKVVIANSRNTCDVLREKCRVPAERIRLMYPGVDVDRFFPAPRNGVVRNALGWDGRRVLLTVGRLQARKGQDRLILAVKQLRDRHPDLLYAIVGDGEERQHLQQLVCEHGLESHVQFRFNANDEELIRCYQQCDLFVLPNREVHGDFEGFGMVLLEAQACGRPVVAGTSGGTAETMEVPTTGRLVCCDEPGPLAELLSELLSDPEQLESMGRAGRRWVMEHFDWEYLSNKAYRLFKSMSGEEFNSVDKDQCHSGDSLQIAAALGREPIKA